MVRWTMTLVALIGLPSVLSAEDVAPPAKDHPLAGFWRIQFHPNQAVRTYKIDADGKVTFGEIPEWHGTLQPALLPAGDEWPAAGAQPAGWMLKLKNDPTECVERLTLCQDGRLLIEHYNPQVTTEVRPDQMGIGIRVRAGKLPGHAYAQDPATGRIQPDPATEHLDAEQFLKIMSGKLKTSGLYGMIGHEIEFTGYVTFDGQRPGVLLDAPETQTGLGRLFWLVNLPADHSLNKGAHIKVRGLIVEHGYGAFFLWNHKIERLSD